jgi:thiol-disulfide isomerase/thioredoxin
MPYLEQVYQDYKGKDFVFVSVNTERTNQVAVREFLEEQKLHFPVYVDSGRLQSRLRVTTYPTAILIDKKGVVRHIHIGATSMVTIRNGIDKLLAE